MTELEWFGRTYRSPVPLPSGYWLAPLVALAVIIGSFLRSHEKMGPSRAQDHAVKPLKTEDRRPSPVQPDATPITP